MTSFLGNHTVKIDSKGRVSFPSAFLKQMSEESSDKFVVKTNIYEKSLIIYTQKEWNRQTEIIRAKTNTFNPKHAIFLREFYKGKAELRLDSNNRILIPSSLLKYAEIDKEVYMVGQDKKIEVWKKDNYNSKELSPVELAELAEEIMGGDLPEL